jgi:shikimate dehydrogenase
MSISGRARLAGIVGWPVAHSLSPRLHGFWLSAHAIDGAYVPLSVEKQNFARVIDALRHSGFVGVNVTVPHKEAAFAICHVVDDAARAAGAVNLLLFQPDGVIEGRNTDAPGLAASLQENLGKGALTGKCAIVLGTGGAARAAVLALSSLGASSIAIVSRTLSRGENLAREMAISTGANIRAFAWSDWKTPAARANIVINATSAGMSDNPAPDIDLDALPVASAVCDLVYNPLETELLKRAQAGGRRAVDGLGMLMHQAAPAFEAFYGERPQVTSALRSELKKALRHG